MNGAGLSSSVGGSNILIRDIHNNHHVLIQGNPSYGIEITDNFGYREYINYHQFIRDGYNRTINGRQIHVPNAEEKEAKEAEKARKNFYKQKVKEQKRLEKEAERTHQTVIRSEEPFATTISQPTTYAPPPVSTRSTRIFPAPNPLPYSRRYSHYSYHRSCSLKWRALIVISLIALAIFQINRFIKK